jgi:hypothetical protein
LPVPSRQFLSSDIRARNAQRDDLTSEQRENELPRPKAPEAATQAVEESTDGGTIDRGTNGGLIVGELGGIVLACGLLIVIWVIRLDNGHDRSRFQW